MHLISNDIEVVLICRNTKRDFPIQLFPDTSSEKYSDSLAPTFLWSSWSWDHMTNFIKETSWGVVDSRCSAFKIAAFNSLATLWRCEGWSKSPNGDFSGSSNAKSARVLSNSPSMAGFCSPLSAKCSCYINENKWNCIEWHHKRTNVRTWANFSASSIFFCLMSSIRCCCWRWKKR